MRKAAQPPACDDMRMPAEGPGSGHCTAKGDW